jgi:hypothetical protein
MMDDNSAILAVMLLAILAATILVLAQMRNRRLLSQARAGAVADAHRIELVTTENDQLRAQVLRLEQRTAVLERIATDPAERTAREIEKLR